MISHGPADAYRFRSQKSWALLAYLVLSERPTARTELATLLFDGAEDPLRALRWSLSELRRALGSEASVEGDPVVLQLPADTVVDVHVLGRGSWSEALDLSGIGGVLLDGVAIREAAAFESWLLSERSHVTAATEAILHEAAVALVSRGEFGRARDLAVRLVATNPLGESNQALLLRLYRLVGDDAAAEQQLAACTELFVRELGVSPGPSVRAAMRERRGKHVTRESPAAIEAIVESGSGAVAAGAVEAGVQSLRTAVDLADAMGLGELRVTARLALAEALIHSLRGEDEEGTAFLHAAVEISLEAGRTELEAQAVAELGYVDFLRARYNRAERWLNAALRLADNAPALSAKVTTYLGSVESDRANYPRSLEHLGVALHHARAAEDPRREAYAQSMIGRVHLLRGDPTQAARHLDLSIEVSEKERWLAFMPWPQALRGEVEMAKGRHEEATRILEQAFARACQLGDPCWEGLSGRALALASEARGDPEQAFALLADARLRCNRLADPYVWLDVYILDAQCCLGLRHDHTDTAAWAISMHDLASRTGMREFVVRSLLHLDAQGEQGAAHAAHVLSLDIENAALDALVSAGTSIEFADPSKNATE